MPWQAENARFSGGRAKEREARERTGRIKVDSCILAMGLMFDRGSIVVIQVVVDEMITICLSIMALMNELWMEGKGLFIY